MLWELGLFLLQAGFWNKLILLVSFLEIKFDWAAS